MSFTIKINGVPVECASAQDALELARLIPTAIGMNIESRPKNAEKVPPAIPKPPAGNSRWGEMTDEAKNVARVLLNSQEPIETNELARLAEIPTMRLKYATKGIKAAMRAQNLNSDVLMPMETIPDGKKRKTVYSITDELRQMWRESLS